MADLGDRVEATSPIKPKSAFQRLAPARIRRRSSVPDASPETSAEPSIDPPPVPPRKSIPPSAPATPKANIGRVGALYNRLSQYVNRPLPATPLVAVAPIDQETATGTSPNQKDRGWKKRFPHRNVMICCGIYFVLFVIFISVVAYLFLDPLFTPPVHLCRWNELNDLRSGLNYLELSSLREECPTA
jgi:hypothetical protein